VPDTELTAALQGAGIGDVDASPLARSLYASDASLYRIPPRVVVRPRDADEVLAALAVGREAGVPITMRGAGTSIAGNAVGPGIVVDTSKHLNQVVAIDREAGTARVQPGTVHATLQRQATAVGLRFGPDPSTHTRCTIGGMIGNNACGSRALAYGRTADNVEGLQVVLADGSVVRVGPDGRGLPDALAALVRDNLGLVRTEFGRFSRQASGYAMEHLLPENGARFDRFLAGTEGTLALLLEAEVRLVEDAPFRALAVLGYASMADAADAVPALLAHPLTACEGLDQRITGLVTGAPELPPGQGWLFAEVTGDTEAAAAAAADAVARTAGVPHRVVTRVPEQLALWRIREDGAGLAARTLSRPAHAGWEDAAVPPEALGAYLREFEALLADSGLDGVPYGHFGDGCVHVRIDFELEDTSGRRRYRQFVEAAADLVAGYGGSMSGEHGDGRARSELLTRMYSAEAIRLMGQVKHLLDPDNVLNPGVLVDPEPLDQSIRLAAPASGPLADLFGEVHRCTGVGRCIADNTPSGGIMCPSYVATRNEKDSTRGRSRVLQDVVTGRLSVDDEAVEQALDLCLSCKGCARDCPTGVDMATYKSHWLQARYDGRARPRSHYTLGRLPRWAAITPPKVANRMLRSKALARIAKSAAGVDQRRSLPRFSEEPLRSGRGEETGTPDVWIWADSFTNHFSAHTGRAALDLLEAAGITARVIPEPACCALTWITTGQLDEARRILRQSVPRLHGYVSSGVPVVGLEPSCLASLRSDAVELLDDPRAAEVAAGVQSLAEFLTARGWSPPDLTGVEVIAQPHCHQAAVVGFSADRALLERAGAAVTVLGGCCGLAGNFGVEKGHYETSVAIAEHTLLPAVRSRGEDTVVLADGMSCRIQLDDLAGVRALHLAELLAAGARIG
jgi:FAD/FMN-containing dehydrogenase/Fe-S oxidoreductase